MVFQDSILVNGMMGAFTVYNNSSWMQRRSSKELVNIPMKAIQLPYTIPRSNTRFTPLFQITAYISSMNIIPGFL
ncbi:MAG: hypothetical protein ACOCVN_00370 [bacterium]